MGKCSACGAKAGFMKSLCDQCVQVDYACKRVKRLADTRDIQALIATLDHLDWHVRQAAAVALGQLRDPQAVESLGRTLNAEYQRPMGNEVRRAASWALVQIGEPAARDCLAGALKDEFGQWDLPIALALSELGDSRALEPLLSKMKSCGSETRALVAQALGRLGDDRAVEPLKRALGDESGEVRASAHEALRHFGIFNARTPKEAKSLAKERRIAAQRPLAIRSPVDMDSDTLSRLRDIAADAAADAALAALANAEDYGAVVKAAYKAACLELHVCTPSDSDVTVTTKLRGDAKLRGVVLSATHIALRAHNVSGHLPREQADYLYDAEFRLAKTIESGEN